MARGGRPNPHQKLRNSSRLQNGLNLKQAAFAAAYAANGGQGKAAAIAAGYVESNAESRASKLLTEPAVQAEIKRITMAGAARAEVTVERIMDELALGGFADITDFVEWDKKGVRLKDSAKLDKAKRRGIVEVSEGAHGIRIKLMSKVNALELMGKQIGMFKQQLEVAGAGEGPVGFIVVPAKVAPNDIPQEVKAHVEVDDGDD